MTSPSSQGKPSHDEMDDSSSYPPLVRPVLHDNIPPRLLNGIVAQSQYILKQLSIINQQNEWLIEASVNTNTQVRQTNGRLLKLEEWRKPLDDKKILDKVTWLDRLFNFWTVLAVLVGTFGTLAGFIFTILHAYHLI